MDMVNIGQLTSIVNFSGNFEKLGMLFFPTAIALAILSPNIPKNTFKQ